MATIAERVAAGAAFLDKHDPDWWKPNVENAINLATLELADPESCILGQRCPLEVLSDYSPEPMPDDRYWAYAFFLKPNGPDLMTWSRSLGFNESELDEFPNLTAQWMHVIAQRRAAS